MTSNLQPNHVRLRHDLGAVMIMPRSESVHGSSPVNTRCKLPWTRHCEISRTSLLRKWILQSIPSNNHSQLPDSSNILLEAKTSSNTYRVPPKTTCQIRRTSLTGKINHRIQTEYCRTAKLKEQCAEVGFEVLPRPCLEERKKRKKSNKPKKQATRAPP